MRHQCERSWRPTILAVASAFERSWALSAAICASAAQAPWPIPSPSATIAARLVRSGNQQIFDSDRESTHPGPALVPARVGDGPGGAGNANLTPSFDAERVHVGVGLLDQDGLERRD